MLKDLLGDLLFTTNAVMPIVAMVAVGYFLKKLKIITTGGAKEMNKLVFKLFLPVLLFLNVYNIESFAGIDFWYVGFVCIVVVLVFCLALFSVRFVTDDPRKKGAWVQATFRSNYALIGIPLATSIFGASGSALATILSAFTIPLFNILAVIALSIYSDEENKKPNVKEIALDIIKNPLIDAIALGAAMLLVRALFVEWGIDFRISSEKSLQWFYSALTQISKVATPLALIVLGANFEFSAIPSMKKEIISGVAVRCVVTPIIGLSLAFLIGGFSGAEFAAFVSVFGTSVAVSTVPMAQEMDSDAELAGQLVVWTTVISALTLFVFIYALRAIGIF
ncbi:MAG: AEC family transporter [Ruminococcaceae bacterium]|nr:AEC family transporter [Oscillospiraceae bacterium]